MHNSYKNRNRESFVISFLVFYNLFRIALFIFIFFIIFFFFLLSTLNYFR